MSEWIDALVARPFLLDVIWQSSVATLLGLGAARLWRRDPDFAHAALRVGLLGALCTPLLSLLVRGVGLGWLAPSAAGSMSASTLPADATMVTASGSASVSVWTVLLVFWAIASSVVLIRLFRSVHHGRRVMTELERVDDADAAVWLSEACAVMGVRRVPRLATGVHVKHPFIWCWGDPVIVLPGWMVRSLADGSVRDVLRHELAHLRRRDHVWSLCGSLCVVLMPWHPGVLLSVRRMRELSESASDRRAVESGADPSRLAAVLLDMVVQPSNVLAPGARTTGHRFARRIHVLLDGGRVCWRAGASLRLSSLGVAMVLIGAGAMVQETKFVELLRATRSAEQVGGELVFRTPDGGELRFASLD